MALTAVRLKKVGNTDVVEVTAGSGGDGEVECEDGGGGGDDALIDECSSGGGGEVAVDAGDGEGDTGGTTDCGDEPAKVNDVFEIFIFRQKFEFSVLVV